MTTGQRFSVGSVVLILAVLALAGTAGTGARPDYRSRNDFSLDNEALLFASTATYGRGINGVSYNDQVLMTVGGYQYAVWYHNGSDQDIYLARRQLTGNTWQIMDTGQDMDNTTTDAHNVVLMGISGDGVIHLSYDHHNNTLRYMNTAIGAATGSTWNSTVFNTERSSLNAGGTTIADVTYPRFSTDPTSGQMVFTYRTGPSGNGDSNLATYQTPRRTVGVRRRCGTTARRSASTRTSTASRWRV